MTGIDRRTVLLSIGALGALVACGPTRATLTFDDFVRRVVPLAEASVAKGVADQPRYLAALSALADRVGWPTRGRDLLVTRYPVIIAALELRAGETFPLHDHRGYCAALRTLSGTVTVRSYDAVPHPRELRVVARAPVRLGPGAIAIAGDRHGNIHGIDCEQDALLVDIFTLYGNPRSRRITLAAAHEDGTYTARIGATL